SFYYSERNQIDSGGLSSPQELAAGRRDIQRAGRIHCKPGEGMQRELREVVRRAVGKKLHGKHPCQWACQDVRDARVLRAALVPKLCLGMNGSRGSASREPSAFHLDYTLDARTEAEPPRQRVPRQEPGNEGGTAAALDLHQHPRWLFHHFFHAFQECHG